MPYVAEMGKRKNNTADTRVIGYARVSTDDQDMALQVKALEEFGCDAVVKEHGSGGKMDRPGWNHVLKAIHPGDTIAVWKLDRLGRTLTGVIEAVEEVEKKGAEFVALDGSVNTKTAMGRAFFQIAAVFAELERSLISERTKAGIAIRQAQGVRFGQPHSIADNQARLDAFRPYVEDGTALTMTPSAALAILNDPTINAGKPIKSLETYRRWRREGFEGIE